MIVQTVQWETLKLSRKKTAKVLVVRFSGALEQGPAQGLGAYHLVALGKAKKSGGRSSKPVPIHHVDYEETVSDLESVARQLLTACGLEWDDRCLRFHENDRPVQTASALQVRQPMYRRSVGRWKRYEAHLGPLLEALGHKPAV